MIEAIYMHMNFESFFLHCYRKDDSKYESWLLNWAGARISNAELLNSTMLEF